MTRDNKNMHTNLKHENNGHPEKYEPKGNLRLIMVTVIFHIRTYYIAVIKFIV